MKKVSAAERRVLDGLLEGMSNKAIAARCGCAEPTVKMHIHTMCRRFGVANRTGLALAAMDDLPRKIATLTAQVAGLDAANARLRQTSIEQRTQIATLERALSLLAPASGGKPAQMDLTHSQEGEARVA